MKVYGFTVYNVGDSDNIDPSTRIFASFDAMERALEDLILTDTQEVDTFVTEVE